MINSGIYSCKDFYTAVLLHALGFQLQNVRRMEGKFLEFLFLDKENRAEEAVLKYWNKDEITVDYPKIVESIRSLKGIIKSYSEERTAYVSSE